MTFEKATVEQYVLDGGQEGNYEFMQMPIRMSTDSTTYKIVSSIPVSGSMRTVPTCISMTLDSGEVAMIMNQRGSMVYNVYTSESLSASGGHVLINKGSGMDVYPGETLATVICLKSDLATGDVFA